MAYLGNCSLGSDLFFSTLNKSRKLNVAGDSDLISKYDFVSCGIHNQSQVKGYLLNIRKNCMQKIIIETSVSWIH